MVRRRFFHFYNMGAYDGETETRVMCNFFSRDENDKLHVGQSQIMLASEWPTYRDIIERSGWKHDAAPF